MQSLSGQFAQLCNYDRRHQVDRSFAAAYLMKDIQLVSKPDMDAFKELLEVIEDHLNARRITRRNYLELMAVLRGTARMKKVSHNLKEINRMISEEVPKLIRDNLSLEKTYQLVSMDIPYQNLSDTLIKLRSVPQEVFSTLSVTQRRPISQMTHLSDLTTLRTRYDKPTPQFNAIESPEFIEITKSQNTTRVRSKSNHIISVNSPAQNILMQKAEQPVIFQKDKMVCAICLTEASIFESTRLSCDHIFDNKCMNEHLKELIMNSRFPLRCPDGECGTEIQINEVSQIMCKKLLEKYYDFSFKHYVQQHSENTCFCPTQKCNTVFEHDPGAEEFECPTCKINFCLKCKQMQHEGLTCEENQQIADQNEDFFKLTREENFQRCPSCKFWVQKNDGCDHMTCLCSFQFCYVCGVEYENCVCDNGGGG